MKLAVSNIAWTAEDDERMYGELAARDITRLEIAPTRVLGDAPYDDTDAAAAFAERLSARHGLQVVSMQSIWFGRTERLFGTDRERATLSAHTKRAVDTARALGCANLVFGSPKNRAYTGDEPTAIAREFFGDIGRYAAGRGARISLEANPTIYDTNFLNTTGEVLTFVEDVDSPGIAVNLDIGTMVCNGEAPVVPEVARIGHVHLSEPWLAPIERRDEHRAIADALSKAGYDGVVSLEMKSTGDLGDTLRSIDYLCEVFR